MKRYAKKKQLFDLFRYKANPNNRKKSHTTERNCMLAHMILKSFDFLVSNFESILRNLFLGGQEASLEHLLCFLQQKSWTMMFANRWEVSHLM